jgi:hypothetical protein
MLIRPSLDAPRRCAHGFPEEGVQRTPGGWRLPVSPIAATEGELIAHKDAQLRAADVHLDVLLPDPERQLELKHHLTVRLCASKEINLHLQFS